jgi:carboxymethylenebutenolidase
MNKKIILILILISSILTLGFYYKEFLFEKFSTKNIDITKKQAKYNITFEDIKYFENSVGFLAKPTNSGNFPGVIMIHEWWGLNENIKEQAKQLAGEGYIVLAVDLFGKVASKPEDAMSQVRALDQNVALENMKAAKKYLNSNGAKKIGALGWCFGGAQSLQISLNQDLDATVIYYGNLVEDKDKIKNLKSPVLGIFGDKDAQIPVEKVKNFENTLNEFSYENSIHIYEGVGHAFANPSGQNYAPEQTKDAWNKTLKFMEENLK